MIAHYTRKEHPVVISKKIMKMRKFKIGNEKYPNWKLVIKNSKLEMRNIKIGSW
jgi:hypothetical protein